MDILSCESQMAAASYSDGNTTRALQLRLNDLWYLNTDAERCHVLSLPVKTAVSPHSSRIAGYLYLSNLEEKSCIL